MPRTLWKYVFLETARLVLIASTVLVTVIAFAATIKPLADGKLNAAQAVTFMGLAIPPMLAYALPFAAGFGTTLAYHRLADDNEYTAARAGGLSHRAVLVPAIAVGLVLSLSIALLNDQVIPRFLRKMEQIITLDLTQVMINQLDRGQSAAFDNLEIYADDVLDYPLEPGSPYQRTVRLMGLAAIQADDDGNIVTEATAQSAWLMIFPAASLSEEQRIGFSPNDTIARIVFDDGSAYVNGDYVTLADTATRAYPLPSVFDDDPKYLTGAELAQLDDHPENMSFIDRLRLNLARAIASVQSEEVLTRRASTMGQLIFSAPAGRTVILDTAGLARTPEGHWQLNPPRGETTIAIEELAADGTVSRSRAATAKLVPQTVSASADLFAPGEQEAPVSMRFRLELSDVEISSSTGDSRIDATTQIAEDVLQNLAIENDPMPALAAQNSAALLDQAESLDNENIAANAAVLRKQIDKLSREVLSKQQERLTMAFSCFVMVITGAVIALKLKDAMPLLVYLWAFFPALGTVILISSGQSTIHKSGLVGVPVIWSGVIALAAYTFLTYRNLARH